jgi:hypothetical protein
VIPALLRPRQQDLKFKGSPGYIARLSQNKKASVHEKYSLKLKLNLKLYLFPGR